VSRFLGALVLDRYAVVLFVELERSVVADLERFYVVSSDVEEMMIRERNRCCFLGTSNGLCATG